MGEVSGLLAIWYREFIVFTREKSRVIASIVNPLLFLVIFGAGLGSSVSVQDMSYQSFIFPGIIAMTLIFTSIFYGVYIIWDKMLDFLKEVLVAPLSRTTIFIGKVLGGVTDAMIQGSILLIIGIILGLKISFTGIPTALLIMLISAIGLVGIGLIIGSLLERPEGFQLIGTFLNFPLFLLSGALFPIDNLPGWLIPFTYANPVTYTVDALRITLIGTGQFNILVDFTVLLIFASITTVVGTISFKRMKM